VGLFRRKADTAVSQALVRELAVEYFPPCYAELTRAAQHAGSSEAVGRAAEGPARELARRLAEQTVSMMRPEAVRMLIDQGKAAQYAELGLLPGMVEGFRKEHPELLGP